MKKISLVVLLIALFPNAGFTQSLSLSGQVTDQQERPLQFAHVHINKQFSLTDEQGSYHFDKLDQGELQIRVSYVGFISLDTIVSLTETRQLNFQLREDAASLETVLLEHTRQRSRPENIQRVSSDYLQQQFTGSLASSLEKLPGMSAMEIGAGASKPIIRGLGFNRVAVTENGIKQEGQQWGADHSLEIDAFSVENIEILKGVGAIAYGSDAIGGVIRIINDQVPTQGFSGEALALTKSVNNSLSASVNLAYRPRNFFYKLKITGSDYGDYSVPTDQIIYLSRNIPIYNERIKNSAGEELNLYGQVGYLGDHFKGTLSVSNVYLKSGFFPGSHGVPSIDKVLDDGDRRNIDYPFQRVNHLKVISKNEWFFHDHSWELILGYQNNHRQEWSRFHTHYAGQEAPEINPDLELDFNLTTYDAQLKFSKDWNSLHTSSFGLQTQFQDNEISGYNFLLPAYERADHGIYAKHAFQPSEDLNLSLGARANFSKIKTETYYDPNLYQYLIDNGQSEEVAHSYASRSSLINRDFSDFNVMGGLLYTFNSNWDFSLNAGTSFRLPTAIELGANGIHHGSFRHEQGDPELDSEKGYVLDARLDYREPSFQVSLSPYVYYFDNYIFLNPSGEFSILPHAGQVYKFTQSKAFLTGVELSLSKRFAEKWDTELVLEYLYNRQINPDRSRNFPLPFTPAVNVFAEVGYEFLTKFSVFKDTRVFGNISIALDQERIAQNEKTTPGYQVFGGGVRTDVDVKGFKAELHLQAMNIFNTRYFKHTSFYRALEIPERGRNIQLLIKVPLN